MPTYEYACRECGEHLEVVQSFKDDPLTTCLSCGGDLRKVFSATGIIFKGSGYYVTDTRKKGGAAAGSSGGGSGSTSDTGAASGSGSSSDAAPSSGSSGGSSSDSSSGSSGTEAKSA